MVVVVVVVDVVEVVELTSVRAMDAWPMVVVGETLPEPPPPELGWELFGTTVDELDVGEATTIVCDAAAD